MALCPICRERETSGRNRVCDSPICREKLKESWYEESIIVPDGYMTATEYARKRGVTVQAVSKKCRAGKIIGAFQDEQSGRWYIPVGTKNVPFPNAKRRKKRDFKATDKEWEEIVNLASQTEHTTNEYMIRILLEKPIKYIDFEKKRR